jgi:hypothetical protein
VDMLAATLEHTGTPGEVRRRFGELCRSQGLTIAPDDR